MDVANFGRVVLCKRLNSIRQFFGLFSYICEAHFTYISVHDGALHVLIRLEVGVKFAFIFLVLYEVGFAWPFVFLLLFALSVALIAELVTMIFSAARTLLIQILFENILAIIEFLGNFYDSEVPLGFLLPVLAFFPRFNLGLLNFDGLAVLAFLARFVFVVPSKLVVTDLVLVV